MRLHLSPDGRIWLGLCGTLIVTIVLVSLPFLPGFRRRGVMREMRACQQNLAMIAGAKEQWALDNEAVAGAPVAVSDIVKPGLDGYLLRMPECPGGFTYSINGVGATPTCPSGLRGHDHSGGE